MGMPDYGVSLIARPGVYRAWWRWQVIQQFLNARFGPMMEKCGVTEGDRETPQPVKAAQDGQPKCCGGGCKSTGQDTVSKLADAVAEKAAEKAAESK